MDVETWAASQSDAVLRSHRGRPLVKPLVDQAKAKRGKSLPKALVGRTTCRPVQPVPELPSHSSRPGRDSVATCETSSASSIYPKSFTTTTDEVSFIDRTEAELLGSHKSDVDRFNADDVAFRLKLLMSNHYSLPPAHSKPVISSLIAPAPAKPPKSPTPRFFDFFRKSKTNPSTPQAEAPAIDLGGPFLRAPDTMLTAGDGLPRFNSLAPASYPSARTSSAERIPTVMVVRERLPDLQPPAHTLQVQSIGRSRSHSDAGTQSAVDVDPTDAVDSPPLSWGQDHDVGELEAPDAAQLALFLPPPPSPSTAPNTPDPWRHALLQQAVTHSLTSTPTGSPIASRLNSPMGDSARSQSHDIPRGSPKSHPRPSLSSKPRPGGRIIDPKLFDREDSPTSSARHRTTSGTGTRPFIRKETLLTSPLHPVPDRPETPALMLTPLTPAPRRTSPNTQSRFPMNSVSAGVRRTPTPSSIRKSVSSPLLHNSYEGGASLSAVNPMPDSPSPKLPHAEKPSMAAKPPSLMGPAGGANQDSDPSRDSSLSTSRSIQKWDTSSDSGLRPDSASPRRLSFDTRCPSPFAQRSFGMAAAHRLSHFSYVSGSTAGSARERPASPVVAPASPPAQLAYLPSSSPPADVLVLAPPPLGRRSTRVASESPPDSPPIENASSYAALSTPNVPAIQVPSPSTPTFGIFDSRVDTRYRKTSQSSLRIQTSASSAPSVPNAGSVISFFDSIQEEQGILDIDSDSTDDEESVYHSSPSVHTTTRSRSDSQPRSTSGRSPSLHQAPSFYPPPSLPNMSTTSLNSTRTTFRNAGIGNTPTRATFFADRKRDGVPPANPLQLYAYTQGSQSSLAVSTSSLGIGPSDDRSPMTPSSPRLMSPTDSSDGGEGTDPRNEDSRKLDGLLLKHIEDERKQLRKITTHRRSNRS